MQFKGFISTGGDERHGPMTDVEAEARGWATKQAMEYFTSMKDSVRRQIESYGVLVYHQEGTT